MPKMDSPARRVLGNKTTNASVRLHHSAKTWKSPTTSRDNLSISFGENMYSPAASMKSKSPRIGQKRRIEQVEEQEPLETQNSNDTQRLSQTTDLFSDVSMQTDEMLVDSMDTTKSTAHTSLTSFNASQAEPEPVEVQFEIHEEMSQRTLDKMHEVSLPQNTSQPIMLLRPNLIKETSQVSVSMSSLIDFDHDKSSQGSDGLQMLEPAEKHETTTEITKTSKSEEDIRKDMLAEKAETLRTRLQLALYKVQTKQISKTFSHLTRPRPRSPELPPLPASSSPISSAPNRHSRLISVSPESKIAIARARATLQVKPPVGPQGKIGRPNIVPSALSARNAENQSTADKQSEIPSSPPLSNGNEAPTLIRASTPSPPAKTNSASPSQLPRTPMQLSSPPGSPDLTLDTAAKKLRDSKHGGLTSSVVKGEAANGLLELMRGGSGNGEEVEA